MKTNTLPIRIDDREIKKMIGQVQSWKVGKIGKIRQTVSGSLLIIQSNAKRNCPVDTGRLRSSIYFALTQSGLGGIVWTDVFYAPYVEFGTGSLVSVPKGFEDFAMQFKGKGKRNINRRPQPFLFPAWEQERPEFTKKIVKILREKGGITSGLGDELRKRI